MEISIIVGLQDGDNGIGINGSQPYHSPKDLNRFKELTMGCVFILGRKTMDDIGKKLPTREFIVVTRNKNYQPPAGVHVVHSYEEAKQKALEFKGQRIFNVGGSSLYEEGLKDPDTTRIFITRFLSGEKKCDKFFPDYTKNFIQVFATKKPRKDQDSKTKEDLLLHFEEWVRK